MPICESMTCRSHRAAFFDWSSWSFFEVCNHKLLLLVCLSFQQTLLSSWFDIILGRKMLFQLPELCSKWPSGFFASGTIAEYILRDSAASRNQHHSEPLVLGPMSFYPAQPFAVSWLGFPFNFCTDSRKLYPAWTATLWCPCFCQRKTFVSQQWRNFSCCWSQNLFNSSGVDNTLVMTKLGLVLKQVISVSFWWICHTSVRDTNINCMGVLRLELVRLQEEHTAILCGFHSIILMTI